MYTITATGLSGCCSCLPFPSADMESADGDSSSSERSFRTGSEGPTVLPKRSQGSGKKKYVLITYTKLCALHCSCRLLNTIMIT